MDTRALPASTMMTSAGSGSVDVAPVVNANDDHLVVGVIDAVEHPIRPAPRYPNTGKLTSELTPNPSWIVQSRTGDEVDDGDRHRLGKLLGERSCRGSSNDELEAIGHRRRERSPRTLSTPRTTSPRATAASPSRRPAIVSGSLRTASVSSRLARSSVLMSTIAGRPLRVTTTRSCSRSTRSTYSEKRSFTVRSASVVMATTVPRGRSDRNTGAGDRGTRSTARHRPVAPGSNPIRPSIRTAHGDLMVTTTAIVCVMPGRGHGVLCARRHTVGVSVVTELHRRGCAQ